MFLPDRFVIVDSIFEPTVLDGVGELIKEIAFPVPIPVPLFLNVIMFWDVVGFVLTIDKSAVGAVVLIPTLPVSRTTNKGWPTVELTPNT